MSQPTSSLEIPEIPDFDSLTAKSAWQWISCFIGWHIPALSEASKKITAKTLNDLPRRVRKILFRSDLLPHKIHDLDSFDPECDSVINHYSFTWALRASAIRDIHSIFRDPKKNRVERYAKGHQLWVPESELRWLKIFKGSRKKLEGQNIQYPIGLRLVTTHPPRIDHDTQTGLTKTTFGEMKNICFDGKRAETNAGYWPLILGNKVRVGQSGDFVQFDHLQSQLGGIKLPKIELGWIWIETGIWGPRKRVLFKKLCSDESIGILIWPQLPGETSPKSAKPTPRIPVYEGDSVELADNDRILVFVGKPRGVNSAVLQINVTYQWVGSLVGSNIAETKYSYPNPCERYPHCLRRPIYSPIQGDEPEILEHAYFPITENPDLADRFNEARKGESSDFFNDTYSQAQQTVLNDLRNGVLPDVVKKFMQNNPPAAAVEMMTKLNPTMMKSFLSDLNSIPEYTVEFPPEIESSESHHQETDEYIIEELDDDVDAPIADTSKPPTTMIVDTIIATPSQRSPQPGPSCLKRTLSSTHLKRAHQKDEDSNPRDLKRRRSVTFAKECQSDLKGKSRMVDSTPTEDLDDETDCPKPSSLSNSSETEESEVEFTPRKLKRRRSVTEDETSSSQPIDPCPMPSASMESLSNRIDYSKLNCSQESEKVGNRRRSSRRRSSGASQLSNTSTSLVGSPLLEGSELDIEVESKVDIKLSKRKRKSSVEDHPEVYQSKPNGRKTSRSKK